MTQDLLKRQNVASVHHEVTGEGVPQNVGTLAFRQLYPGPIDRATECRNGGRSETAPLFQVCFLKWTPKFGQEPKL